MKDGNVRVGVQWARVATRVLLLEAFVRRGTWGTGSKMAMGCTRVTALKGTCTREQTRRARVSNKIGGSDRCHHITRRVHYSSSSNSVTRERTPMHMTILQGKKLMGMGWERGSEEFKQKK